MIGYVRLFEFVFGSGYWGGGGVTFEEERVGAE